MTLRSRFKVESIGLLAASAFYMIAGIVCFAVLAIIDVHLAHIGIIGILSLITAYGLFMKRAWTIWFVVVLFLVSTTFSVYTLFYSFGRYPLLDISVVMYVILTWTFTAYAASRRGILTN